LYVLGLQEVVFFCLHGSLPGLVPQSPDPTGYHLLSPDTPMVTQRIAHMQCELVLEY